MENKNDLKFAFLGMGWEDVVLYVTLNFKGFVCVAHTQLSLHSECRCPWSPEEGIISLGPVTQLLVVKPEKQTQVL